MKGDEHAPTCSAVQTERPELWICDCGATELRKLHAAYVPVYRDRHGCMALMRSGQGRDTFRTRDEAHEWLAAIVRENSPERLAEIWGHQALGTFGVRLVETWPSGDPKGTILDEEAHEAR